MERLIYNKNTQELLENISGLYWRYQESEFCGLIPQGHKSHERMYSENPEYVEAGVSCYDNPYQLLDYMKDEFYSYTEESSNGMDVVIFEGTHTGTYGLDEEDIVEAEEVIYSMSLWDFWQFCKNADEDLYYLSCHNLRELANTIFE